LGAGLILAAFLLLVGFINPLHNVAIADDWDYARTAQHLLYTGIFRRSEIMTGSGLKALPGYRIEQRLTFATLLRAGGTDRLFLLRRVAPN
jgi:hypothetical protein